MYKLILSVFISCLLCTSTTYAQPNTCLMAETVLDSLNNMYRADYYNMVCFTDSSVLSLGTGQLGSLSSNILNDKRILLATTSEAAPVFGCGIKKVRTFSRPVSPDSVQKYSREMASFTRSGRRYSNDAGVRFSNILYNADVAVGYMQLNMRNNTKFYYFLFEKNAQTGNWDMKKLVEKVQA